MLQVSTCQFTRFLSSPQKRYESSQIGATHCSKPPVGDKLVGAKIVSLKYKHYNLRNTDVLPAKRLTKEAVGSSE